MSNIVNKEGGIGNSELILRLASIVPAYGNYGLALDREFNLYAIASQYAEGGATFMEPTDSLEVWRGPDNYEAHKVNWDTGQRNTNVITIAADKLKFIEYGEFTSVDGKRGKFWLRDCPYKSGYTPNIMWSESLPV